MLHVSFLGDHTFISLIGIQGCICNSENRNISQCLYGVHRTEYAICVFISKCNSIFNIPFKDYLLALG